MFAKRVQKCLFFRMAKSRDLGLFVKMLLGLFVKMAILLDDLCKMLRIKARVSSKAQLHTRQVLENCTDSTLLLEKMAYYQVSSYQPVHTLKFVFTELYSTFFFFLIYFIQMWLYILGKGKTYHLQVCEPEVGWVVRGVHVKSALSELYPLAFR